MWLNDIPAQHLQWLQSLGVGWVRLPFHWNRIEKAKGEYDFGVYDVVFSKLAANNIRVLPIVTNWAFPGQYTPNATTCGPLTPSGKAMFQKFLSACMRHWPGVYWQIGNEMDFILTDPNSTGAGGCLGQDPAEYVELLKLAWAAKQSDPTSKIVFAALSADNCFDNNQQPVAGTFNCSMFPECLKLGAGKYFDVAAFNQYHFFRRSHETPSFKGGMLSKINRWRNYLAEYGLSKPLFITETGWQYATDPGLTELARSQQQSKVVAYNLTWTAAAMAQKDRSPLSMVTHFALQNGSNPPDPWGWYGLYLSTGLPGYGAQSFAVMRSLLDGYEFVQDLGEATVLPGNAWQLDTLQRWVFRNHLGLERHVLWIDSGRGIVVNTPTTRLVSFDPSRFLGALTSQGFAVQLNEGKIRISDEPTVVTLRAAPRQVFIPQAQHFSGTRQPQTKSASVVEGAKLMSDVFDGIPLEKHTGLGPMTVAELRGKYGLGLNYVISGNRFKVKRVWERSQVEVIVLHFEDRHGDPIEGFEGRYFWPDAPTDGFPVKSNGDGNIDWPFDNRSYYDARSEVGPYSFIAPGLVIRGMGSPSKNANYNHDSMSFDIIVDPGGTPGPGPGPGPTPEPEPGPGPDPMPGGTLTFTQDEAQRARAALATLQDIFMNATNR